jgi:hypothetical protein
VIKLGRVRLRVRDIDNGMKKADPKALAMKFKLEKQKN